MRKAAILVLLVLVAVSGRALAPVSAEPEETFVLTGQQTHLKPSTEIGDVFLLREALFDGSGERVGTSNISCTESFQRTLVCTAGLVLKGRGQIALGGSIPFEPVFTIGITGGTGEFKAAAGEVRIDVSTPTSVYTIRLL